jgi:hypothetical protein
MKVKKRNVWIFANETYEKMCGGKDLRLMQHGAAVYADLRRLKSG